MISTKKLTLSNMRRFLNENISDTLKNVSQELVMCLNVQSSLGAPLASEIIEFMKLQIEISQDIENSIIESNNLNEFLDKIK